MCFDRGTCSNHLLPVLIKQHVGNRCQFLCKQHFLPDIQHTELLLQLFLSGLNHTHKFVTSASIDFQLRFHMATKFVLPLLKAVYDGTKAKQTVTFWITQLENSKLVFLEFPKLRIIYTLSAQLLIVHKLHKLHGLCHEDATSQMFMNLQYMQLNICQFTQTQLCELCRELFT